MMMNTECAEYKLTVEVYANQIADLEQLLCAAADEIVNGAVAGEGRWRRGSYVFSLVHGDMEDCRQSIPRA